MGVGLTLKRQDSEQVHLMVSSFSFFFFFFMEDDECVSGPPLSGNK